MRFSHPVKLLVQRRDAEARPGGGRCLDEARLRAQLPPLAANQLLREFHGLAAPALFAVENPTDENVKKLPQHIHALLGAQAARTAGPPVPSPSPGATAARYGPFPGSAVAQDGAPGTAKMRAMLAMSPPQAPLAVGQVPPAGVPDPASRLPVVRTLSLALCLLSV